FTISDIFQAAGWIFHVPGDAILYLLLSGKPGSVAFLELSFHDYGGLFSAVASFFLWLVPFGIAVSVYDGVGKLMGPDRWFVKFLLVFVIVGAVIALLFVKK